MAVALVLVGGYLLIARGRPRARPSLPAGAVRSQMLWSGGALIVYGALVRYLGYTASTLVGSTALFRTMGRYRSTTCLFLGVVTTGGLYLVFRVWLRQPLPTGLHPRVTAAQAAFRRGSSRSRSASPSTLNPNTARPSARPGKIESHGARTMYERPVALSIPPHEGWGGGTP